MTNIKISAQPKLLKELADGLAQAVGACSQLTHQMQDPRWMTLREMLELTKEGVMATATFEAAKIRPAMTVN